MSTAHPKFQKSKLPKSARFAVVAARFNADISDELLRACLERFKQLGPFRVDVHRVPGAFELPVTAKLLVRTKKYSAIVCLGAVIRGDTPHFDFVAGEAARGISRVAIEESIPVIFGLLTTNTHKQAKERTGGKHGHAGISAAEAAVEMATVSSEIRASRV